MSKQAPARKPRKKGPAASGRGEKNGKTAKKAPGNPKESQPAATQQNKLTPKQQSFVNEYLVDKNATQAAIRAGYSRKTAKQTGTENLARPAIRAAIDKALDEQAERTQISADKVLHEMALLGFANMQDYMRAGPDGDPCLDFSGLTREQAAALIEVTVEDFVDGRGEFARDVRRVKFKLADKKGALEALGRHFGLFPTKHEHTGKDGGPIETITSELDPQEASRRYKAFIGGL